RVLERQLRLAAREADVLQADQADGRDLHEEAAVGGEREAEPMRQLVLARGTTESALEGARHALDRGRLLAHAARDPVDVAQMIEDGSADPDPRVRREQRFPCRLVSGERVEEAERAPRDEILQIGGREDAAEKPASHLPHEWQVAPQRRFCRSTRRVGARATISRLLINQRDGGALLHTILPCPRRSSRETLPD